MSTVDTSKLQETRNEIKPSDQKQKPENNVKQAMEKKQEEKKNTAGKAPDKENEEEKEKEKKRKAEEQQKKEEDEKKQQEQEKKREEEIKKQITDLEQLVSNFDLLQLNDKISNFEKSLENQETYFCIAATTAASWVPKIFMLVLAGSRFNMFWSFTYSFIKLLALRFSLICLRRNTIKAMYDTI